MGINIKNNIRKVEAKLVNATIDKYGASYPAQSPWRADGFNKVFVETEGANPTQKDFLEGNSSVYVYAIGSNIGSLLPYSLASFTNIKELYLFSPTMVNIGAIDNDYLTYLTDSDLKVYVPSSKLQDYITTYGGTGKHLENRFDEITDDYPLTVSGSGDLTSQELTNQLMNNYESVDRTNCTKLIIQGFTNASSVIWGYDFSEVLPNLNNNIWVNGVKLDFSTFIIQDTIQDHILTASVVSANVNAISPSAITAIEKIVVPIDFTSYASGSITELQAFMNTNSIDKLVTTYEAGEMELSLSGDIVAKIVSIGKTLDEALVYAKNNNWNSPVWYSNNNNLILLPQGNRTEYGSATNRFGYFYNSPNIIAIYNLVFTVWNGTISGSSSLNSCIFRYMENCLYISVTFKSKVLYPYYIYIEELYSVKEYYLTFENGSEEGKSMNVPPNVYKVLLNGFTSNLTATSTNLDRQALVDLINSLGTPATQQTLTIGATNLAKLTNADIQIAYDKNWQLSPTPSAFTFTIGSNTYSCDFGMTWEQWCASGYNLDGYSKFAGYVIDSNGNYVKLNDENVSISSMIKYGDTFTIQAYFGVFEYNGTLPDIPSLVSAKYYDDESCTNEVLVSNLVVGTTYYYTLFFEYGINFATDTWEQIKFAYDNNLAQYQLGDTKSITYDNNTYTIRLCDIGNRYDLSNGNGKNNIVCEFVECLPTTYKMNNTNTNSGGWALSNMKTNTMPSIYNNLPSDLKNVISQVKIASANGGSDATGLSYSDNYLFLPSEYEIFGVRKYSNSIEQTSQFQLYLANNNATFRIKYKLDNTPIGWWERSPFADRNTHFCLVWTDGNADGDRAGYSNGVAPFFCI